MKKSPTIIYAVAFLRTIASAISGFAIEVYIRLSGASDLASSLVVAVPFITYVLAALFLSARANRIGQRRALLISSAVTFIATLLYMSIFQAMTSIVILIGAVIFIEAVEGLFTGWFWPVLQTRLGENVREDNRAIRFYNLSWNLGIVIGNALVASYAGVSSNPEILFPIILQTLIWGMIINGVIFSLLWAKFMPDQKPGTRKVVDRPIPTVIPTLDSPRKITQRVPISVWVSLGALFVFAFNMGGILTNIFNQVTMISGSAVIALNLLPWLPLIDTTRQMTQLGASGVHKSVNPSSQDVTRLVYIMSVLSGLIGFASHWLTRGGVIIILFAIGIHGVLSGMLYNKTMQVLLRDTPVHLRGRFLGMYEAVLGLGFFTGPILAGAISDGNGYLASYSVLTGISFLLTAVLVSVQVKGTLGKFVLVKADTKLFPIRISYLTWFFLGLVGLWAGLRMLGELNSFNVMVGVTIILGGTGSAAVIFLKPRSDFLHAFDRFRSRRPHILVMCTPNSTIKQYALTATPFEIIPLVPC